MMMMLIMILKIENDGPNTPVETICEFHSNGATMKRAGEAIEMHESVSIIV